MEYFDLINQSEFKFYKNFIPTKEFKIYEMQAKIITSSILLLLMEQVLLRSNEEIKEVHKIISRGIDKSILADGEIIKRVRSILNQYEEDESELRFAYVAIFKNIRIFKKLNMAIANGTLKEVVTDLERLFYATYIKPLNDSDRENYFGRWLSEFLKYKEIFFSDYKEHTRELRIKLLSLTIS